MEWLKKKINKILTQNGGFLISDLSEYKNARTKLKWQCKNGHEFEASWNKVQQGRWCPFCAGRHLGIKDANEIANSRGGRCLSKSYVKSIDKLLWECELGHQWKASFNAVKNSGSWCPYCSTSVGENMCRQILEKAFNTKFPKIRPSWLLADGFRLELDGYNEKLGLAFEYQGAQHFGKSYKNQNIQKVIRNDKIKLEKCSDMGVNLIIINDSDVSKEYSIKKQLSNELIKLKIDIDILSIDVDYSSLYSYGYLDELKQIAESRGGDLLSGSYKGTKEKYKWKCERGHVWEASAYSVKSGSWCGICNNPNLMSNADLLRELEEIKESEPDLFRKRILQKTILKLSRI